MPPVDELSLATWQRYLDVNLTGTFLVTKHALPHDTIAYAATKGGIVALTHALAISVGPAVRVNCIEPGWIAGRVGRPEDVAGLCAWLLSAEAEFVTGASFVVDGRITRKMVWA